MQKRRKEDLRAFLFIFAFAEFLLILIVRLMLAA
nr:MAG TPA: hypothetical protein [Caudoviricetes sp.]